MNKICIGVATRKRPEMFARLLDSLICLNRPDGVLLQFVFIENDDVLHINEAVKDFSERLGQEETAYVDIESRLGIPVVRNRILDTASGYADVITLPPSTMMKSLTPIGWLNFIQRHKLANWTWLGA